MTKREFNSKMVVEGYKLRSSAVKAVSDNVQVFIEWHTGNRIYIALQRRVRVEVPNAANTMMRCDTWATVAAGWYDGKDLDIALGYMESWAAYVKELISV